jgi:ABC-2 type transport system permease protein
MIKNIIIYCKIVLYQLHSQFEYPVNAIAGFINQFFVFFLEFVSMWALFDLFGQIDGWKFTEVFLTYGIVNMSFAMAEIFMRGFESNMTTLVRNGEYDRYLLRPCSTILQISAFNFQFVRLGRFIQSIVVLFIGLYMNRGSIYGTEWGLLIYATLGGCLLYFALYIITGIVNFKVMQYTEFMSIFVQGSVSTMQYPMTAFPKWIQNIFTYVLPVALVTYFPIATVLDKSIPFPRFVGYCAPTVCYLVFFITLFIFHRVEKSYISSGS